MEYPMFYDLTGRELFKDKWHIGTEENPFVSLCGRADSGAGLPTRYNENNQTTTLCPICAHRLITKQATENADLTRRVQELEAVAIEISVLRTMVHKAWDLLIDPDGSEVNGSYDTAFNNWFKDYEAWLESHTTPVASASTDDTEPVVQPLDSGSEAPDA